MGSENAEMGDHGLEVPDHGLEVPDHGLEVPDHGLTGAEVQAADTIAAMIAEQPKLKELFLTIAEKLFEKEEAEASS